MNKIGILHPGEMGISVAASAVNSGYEVYWSSQDRSDTTRARAEKYKLNEVESLSELCLTCEIILSICPPHAAEDVALSVLAMGFQGLYLDANAIAPQHSIKLGHHMESAGIQFVDGGIIGGPAWTPKETWLYLSGSHAKQIASCFSNGPLGTKIIGEQIGKASALKMCYAAYSKGTTAVLAAILAVAESFEVRENLYEQWDVDDVGFSDQVNQKIRRAAAKAWRFEGEMKEIATTFRDAGLPNGFHGAAAEIYHRMASLKNSDMPNEVDDILATISAGID